MPKTTKQAPAAPPQKSIGSWVALAVAPFATLIAVAMLQVIVHASTVNSGSDSPLIAAVNVMCVLLGIVSVVLLILLPVWIVMIVKTINMNEGKGLNKVAAIILAVVFGLFAWLYTYEKDSTKFWINLVLSIVTLSLWQLVAWVWAIVDAASRPDEFYTQYPNYEG